MSRSRGRVVVALLLGCVLALPLLRVTATAQEVPGSVAGRVTDTAGVALEAIAVRAGDAATTTGTDGTYRIERLAAGTYEVTATDPAGDHAPAATTVEVRDGQTTTADLVLDPAATIAGTVTDLDGRRVAGATVTTGDVSATSDEDGSYVLRGLGGGEHLVDARADGYRPARTTVTVATGGSADAPLRLLPLDPEVVRIAGADRIATAVAVSQRAFPAGAPAAVLASDRDFPDALAAAPLADRLGGPVLLAGARLDARVRDELRRLEAASVTIVGGVAAVPFVVERELEVLGWPVSRIAGADRYDTAALIARQVGAPDGVAVLASGESFVGALVAAPLDLPILLTRHDGVPDDTRAALEDLEVARTFDVGGDDPYEVAVSIAERIEDRSVVAVARVDTFADALTAASLDVPLLLVNGATPTESDATWTWLDANRARIGRVLVLGGEDAIEPDVAARIGRLGAAR